MYFCTSASLTNISISLGWTHGIMVADKYLNEGKTAYVTHFSNPGIHKLNLETKSYTRFINLKSQGCSGTYGIAYNSYNSHLYVECLRNNQSSSNIEIYTTSNVFIGRGGIPGFPFVSPDGKYVVALSRDKSTSRMNILAIKTRSSIYSYGELRIPGGVSHAVFYPKSKNPDSYYAFVTLDYSNKMAVVDLDLAESKNILAVTYIENVDELDTTPHGASRDLFIGGKWIISPATKSKTVVIINADTRKVHGKISDVNGGSFAVWVPGKDSGSGGSGGSSGIAGSTSLIIVLFGFLLFSN